MRPNPPPKPNKLRTGGSTAAVSPTKPQPGASESELNGGALGDAAEDDWEKKFAKRYPSLSGLEMVETVIGRDP
jgi:AP2-associated kinase